MRTTLVVAATLACFSFALPVRAQDLPTIRTITVPEVDVRSAASDSDKVYSTGKLKQFDKVVVLGPSEQSKDWLRIKPPAGSFSWINALFVEREPNHKHIGIIHATDNAPTIPVFAGSAVFAGKPNTKSAELPKGTAVIILGDQKHADDGNWFPIDVSEKEVRYIPASAVANSLGEPVPLGTSDLSSQVIKQAKTAAELNNFASARVLLLQALHQPGQFLSYGDRIACQKQLDEIDARTGGNTVAAGQPGNPAQVTQVGKSPVQAQFANQVQVKTVSNSPPTLPAASTPQPLAPSTTPRWSPTWGKLQRSQLSINGLPTFVLVDGQKRVIVYAVTPPHLALDSYENQLVCLWGTVGYRSEIRAYYMNVTYLARP